MISKCATRVPPKRQDLPAFDRGRFHLRPPLTTATFQNDIGTSWDFLGMQLQRGASTPANACQCSYQSQASYPRNYQSFCRPSPRPLVEPGSRQVVQTWICSLGCHLSSTSTQIWTFPSQVPEIELHGIDVTLDDQPSSSANTRPYGQRAGCMLAVD